MSGIGGNRRYWEIFDLIEGHRAVPGKAPVFGRNFACSILKLPRRIRENRSKSAASRDIQ